MKRPQPNPHGRKIPPRLAELPTQQVLAQYAAHACYVDIQ